MIADLDQRRAQRDVGAIIDLLSEVLDLYDRGELDLEQTAGLVRQFGDRLGIEAARCDLVAS
jgi:hypothetical protein